MTETFLDEPATQDQQAEQSVLGALLLSRQARDEVLDGRLVEGPDFYRPAHELIYAAILDLHGQGRPVDAVTVASELGARGQLAPAGGPAYLHTLVSDVPTAANAGWYARIVREKAVFRRLAQAGMRIVDLGRKAVGSVDEAAAEALAQLETATTTLAQQGRGVYVADVLDDALESMDPATDRPEGITWGWRDLDELVDPLTPGQMWIVAARSGVGKSLFCGCVATHAALRLGSKVLLHTLEMTRLEVTCRFLAAMSRTQLTTMRRRQLKEVDWERVAQASTRLSGAQLVIDDDPILSIGDLRASVRRHTPDLVVVDQLSLMRADPRVDRRQQLDQLAYQLKELARSEGIPVLVAHQLNRAPTQRSDHRPMPSDLRDSDALQHAADGILLLHREDLYDPGTPRVGEVDVIVGKQRNGRTGAEVALGNQAHYGRFVDLAT